MGGYRVPLLLLSSSAESTLVPSADTLRAVGVVMHRQQQLHIIIKIDRRIIKGTAAAGAAQEEEMRVQLGNKRRDWNVRMLDVF